MLNVQLDIRGEWTGVTTRTQIVGARNLYPTHGGQYGFRAQFAVLSLLAAQARHSAFFVGGRGEAQQFGQGGCAHTVHG